MRVAIRATLVLLLAFGTWFGLSQLVSRRVADRLRPEITGRGTATDPGLDSLEILHPGAGNPAVCVCDQAIRVNGWCDHCRRGFVGGVTVASELFFETIDPHGHEIDITQHPCTECQTLYASDGFCDSCRIGWSRGKAFMTRLTWLLARGRSLDVLSTPCDECREAVGGEPRWCDSCAHGICGRSVYPDHDLFSKAGKEFKVFEKALSECRRCEICACAMMTDGICPDCRRRYQGGVEVPLELPDKSQESSVFP